MKTTLLSINDFQDWIGLSENIPYSTLEPFVLQAQTLDLKKIICNNQLDALVNAWENDDFTTEETTLMNYITPYLVFKSYNYFLRQNGLINTGVGFKVSLDPEGTSEPLSDSRLESLYKSYGQQAETYANELKLFLDNNSDNYPLWRDSDCSCIEQKTNIYIMGIGKKQIAREGDKYLKITKYGSPKN